MIGAVVMYLLLVVLAVAAWLVITALDTSSCLGCGHEFGPGEEVHVVGHRLGVRVLCGRCFRAHVAARRGPAARG